MTDSNEYFKTNDMGLAAYLIVCGHSCQGQEWQGRNCFWKFLLIPDVNELVQLWVTRKASVEPVSYNKEFYQLKVGLLTSLHGARE